MMRNHIFLVGAGLFFTMASGCGEIIGLPDGEWTVVDMPSCSSLPDTCGPAGNESCCAVTQVPGGSYNRQNVPELPATVSDFSLDRFEITVGRFRKFVEAYPGSRPKAGAGKHPRIPQTGWDAQWDPELPADQAALMAQLKCDATWQTWTDGPGPNENKPINCLSWYTAFAFCAWDAGRLPTSAEWGYAAAGGSEQRVYPWSNPPNATTIDSMNYAVYDCAADGLPPCGIPPIIQNVGSKSPLGDGRWLQADLAGNLGEWNFDTTGAPTPCNDCASMQMSTTRTWRGGIFAYPAPAMESRLVSANSANTVTDTLGARCARGY